MDRRLAFNEDPALYDRRRPRYCPELFRDVLEYGQLGPGKLALEVGCGTGQATKPFLDAGLRVTAVELGVDLSAYVRQKYAGYPSFTVHTGSFEEYAGEADSLDLLYSATAFHWIAEEVGYLKAFRLLRPGGCVALFWNRPRANQPSEATHQDLQKVYQRYHGDSRAKSSDPAGDQERYRAFAQRLRDYGFAQVEMKLYHQVRTFTSETYLELLETYSDHRLMDPAVKEPFYGEIRQVIEDHGGIMNLYDTMDLYLGRKPAR